MQIPVTLLSVPAPYQREYGGKATLLIGVFEAITKKKQANENAPPAKTCGTK
jgi:hypothetical protein